MLFQRVSHSSESLCQQMHMPLEQAGGGGYSLCYLKECGFLEVVYAVQTATLYTLTCKYFSLICINFEPNCLYCNKIF